MTKCDLDACSLKGDIETIKNNQAEQLKAHNEMMVAQTKLIGEIGAFAKASEKAEKQNGKEHEVLFERSTGVVKWNHIFKTLGGIVAFLTIISIIFAWTGVI